MGETEVENQRAVVSETQDLANGISAVHTDAEFEETQPARKWFSTPFLCFGALLLAGLCPVGDIDGDGGTDVAGQWIMLKVMTVQETAKTSGPAVMDKSKPIVEKGPDGWMPVSGVGAPSSPPINKWSMKMEREIEDAANAEYYAELKAKEEAAKDDPKDKE